METRQSRTGLSPRLFMTSLLKLLDLSLNNEL